MRTCVWTKNVSISIVESDSQWVLTNTLNQWLVLWLRRFLYCLIHDCCAFMLFLLTIFLYFPSWILILSLSRSEDLFSYIYLAEGPWSNSKTMFWWLIITTIPCHIETHKAITITSRCKILHRSGNRGVLSMLSLYIRGSRTLSDPQPRSKGQSRCI